MPSMCSVIQYQIVEVKDGDQDNTTLLESTYSDTIEIVQNTGVLKITNFGTERNLYISIETQN